PLFRYWRSWFPSILKSLVPSRCPIAPGVNIEKRTNPKQLRDKLSCHRNNPGCTSGAAMKLCPLRQENRLMAQSADRIAVSTWSLHRLLGTTYPHNLDSAEIGPGEDTYGEGSESLLGLPSVLANHGYHRLEIVSFHMRSRDPVYLGELRDQLKVSG